MVFTGAQEPRNLDAKGQAGRALGPQELFVEVDIGHAVDAVEEQVLNRARGQVVDSQALLVPSASGGLAP